MPWYRKPAAQFVVLGVLLFFAKRELLPAVTHPVLTITPGRLARLRADFERQTGHAPSSDDERVMLERAVDDEILYREALAYGFDRHDPSIKFRLTEKMRFVSDVEEAPDEAPIDEDLYRKAVELGFDKNDSLIRGIMIQKVRLMLARQADRGLDDEGALRAYYERHRDRYVQASRVSLWHVFVKASPASDEAELHAGRLLERLRAESSAPAAAVRLGDPFPLGVHLESQSTRDLQKIFGAQFAERVMAMQAGVWQGPVSSPQGLHLVLVEARQAERTATFEAVRSRVLAERRAEQRQAHLAETLRQLREKYVVRVADVTGAWRG